MAPASMTAGNDCFRACIATILGLPIDQFPVPPQILTEETWGPYSERMQEIVRGMGFEMLTMDTKGGDFVPRGLSIASYPSPSADKWADLSAEMGLTETILHAVVANDGEVVFDPCPEYREIGVTYEGPPRDWVVFQALAPAQLLQSAS